MYEMGLWLGAQATIPEYWQQTWIGARDWDWEWGSHDGPVDSIIYKLNINTLTNCCQDMYGLSDKTLNDNRLHHVAKNYRAYGYGLSNI